MSSLIASRGPVILLFAGTQLETQETDPVFLRELERVHLQWFAAEDEGRTEEPTEHKIRKAREEGKVAKSQEVSAAILLLSTVVALALLSRYMLNTLIEMASYFLGSAAQRDIAVDGFAWRAFLDYLVRTLVPILVVAFVAAVLGNLVQVGFLFSTKPITPDLNKIVPNLGKFVQKSFLSMEALFNLSKSLGKVAIIVLLAFFNIRNRIGEIVNLVNVSLLESFSLISSLAFNILAQTAVFLLILSFFDYRFQRHQHIESLKMTKQEIKEERKTYEGDPLIKSRLRQRMKELLTRNMIRNVPQADVVITNPTHFAVALEYKRDSMPAPMVIAKGADELAGRIRGVAEENGVPIIENKPLARALYAEVEIGDVIPEKFYEAAVTVLTQVYRMNQTHASGQA
jgi:flagellar biosynthesis protein FlhB